MTPWHLAAVAALVVARQPALDERAVTQFVRELQRDLARGDRTAVAARVRYPLTVLAGTVRIPIDDTDSLIDNFEIVFTPTLKALIAQAAQPQDRSTPSGSSLVVSGDVATIGTSAVRIEAIAGTLRITGIAVPLAPSVSVFADTARAGVTRQPERLVPGISGSRRAGALAPGEQDVYTVTAAKNQLFEVRLTGVTGRDIVARIVNANTQAPIDARARDGVRTWIGRIPEDGDYQIEVIRRAASGPAQLRYLISVTLR